MPDDVIERLRNAPWHKGQLVHVERVPASAAERGAIRLDPRLEGYLEAAGISLYRHQVEAIEALRAGRDVILTTPTASGKTLAYNLPILEGLLEDREACALYLYPLKALANDQLQRLLDLERATGAEVSPSTYDGDTARSRRRRIRQSARIILTNPHALHFYLPWHHQWGRFFGRLRTVVIDEAHWYRGVFGSNVSLLLWRWRRVLSQYGAAPQIVLSSASVANPTNFARDLIGREAVSIAADTSAHGERHILFWDPLCDPRQSITRQAARLLTFLTQQGIQTLCFAASRATAEVISRTAAEFGATDVVSYRAGYLPEERRAIEAALRDRRVGGVVSTNALEAGIDVGSLDAVVLVGFPGSLISAWQQAGRAGRGTAPSLVVYLPHENPLDRYFLGHPERFLGRERERIVLRTDRPKLRAGHLACAAAEIPLRDDELDADGQALLKTMVSGGLLAATPRGHIYRGTVRAHDAFGLDRIPERGVRLTSEGKLLETMDRLRACRDAYPGAVYLHRGETYVVESLDLEAGTASARREDVDFFTKSLRTSLVDILDVEESVKAQSLLRARGRVRVTERFVGFKSIHDDRTITTDSLDLPPHAYETDALWIGLPETNFAPPADLVGALHGAEHALIAVAPLLVLCDREDVGGASTARHPQTGLPTILLFDEIEDGAGLAEVLYVSLDRLARESARLVADCPCVEGCPSCLYSPRCGSQNQPLSKAGAVRILEHICRAGNGEGSFQ